MATVTYVCCKEIGSCNKLGQQKKEIAELARTLNLDVVQQISENISNIGTTKTPGMTELINLINNREVDSVIFDIQDIEHSHDVMIDLCDTCYRNRVSLNSKQELQKQLEQRLCSVMQM